jgi:predicted acylesterase/phospholipase RssA
MNLEENTGNHNQDINLLIGTGGSRSILFGTGVLLVLAQANFRRFRSITGVSGGSIPAALISANADVTHLLAQVLDTDFNQLVARRVSLVKFLTQALREPKAVDPPPLEGALDATLMGQYFDDRIKDWPNLFCTVALSHQAKVIFTKDGVWHEQQDGTLLKVAAKPIPIGMAVRATCAVPILLDPVAWKSDSGEEHLLIDGGLGPEGRCPISVPQSLFAMENSYLVVVNVGEDKSTLHQLIDKVYGIISHDRESLRMDGITLADNHDRIVISPPAPLYGSFKFSMTRREKWQMIMSGYMSAVEALEKHGLLSNEALTQARNRGVKALLLLAGRNRHYFKDSLPLELDKLFVDLKFAEDKLSHSTAAASVSPTLVGSSTAR